MPWCGLCLRLGINRIKYSTGHLVASIAWVRPPTPACSPSPSQGLVVIEPVTWGRWTRAHCLGPETMPPWGTTRPPPPRVVTSPDTPILSNIDSTFPSSTHTHTHTPTRRLETTQNHFRFLLLLFASRADFRRLSSLRNRLLPATREHSRVETVYPTTSRERKKKTPLRRHHLVTHSITRATPLEKYGFRPPLSIHPFQERVLVFLAKRKRRASVTDRPTCCHATMVAL